MGVLRIFIFSLFFWCSCSSQSSEIKPPAPSGKCVTSVEIAPKSNEPAGAFHVSGKHYQMEYAPSAFTKYYELPSVPVKWVIKGDVVVFALGRHGLWIVRYGRQDPQDLDPGFHVEMKYTCRKPVTGFALNGNTVTPTYKNH
ncbi:hypothetical protein KKF34_05470 [Myxococcota bacterium]|nr:hypothetical protein [Myxococcota bacterium]MBU1379613.1 hypothetical protein [Myxococcota bacterium]MBU1496310.1 hypothetical protein [Myxococcota bacterium]